FPFSPSVHSSSTDFGFEPLFMAYSPLLPPFIENSQQKHWLFRSNSRKIDIFEEITSDFTGYFFTVGIFIGQ
ncbi:MAG: hypothetical protein J7639_33485, partial [Paenibacillaceae bacterium]|nr:hypothetical protein [Paenibacillaceae bacterium]